MLKRFLLALLALAFIFCLCPAAFAAVGDFTFLAPESAKEGALLRVELSASQSDAAAFRISLEYDTGRLTFVRTELSGVVRENGMYTSNAGNFVKSVYASVPVAGVEQTMDGTVVAYVFRVNEDVSGDVKFKCVLDQLCGSDGKELGITLSQEITMRVGDTSSAASSNSSGGGASSGVGQTAELRSLVPSVGELFPPFSPEELSYFVDVPWDVSTVEFAAAAYNGGLVRVSRKALQKAGAATPISITVTSRDGKTRTQYLVTVYRAEKPESAPASSEAQNAAASKPSSKAAASVKDPANGGTLNSSKKPKSSGEPEAVSAKAEKSSAHAPAETAAVEAAAVQPQRSLTITGSSFGAYAAGTAGAVLCLAVGYFAAMHSQKKKK